MKILASIRAISVTTTILLLAACSTKPVPTTEGPPRKKTAIIAVSKGKKLRLAGDKSKLVRSMQQAFESVKQKEVVRDLTIYSVGKLNYLAVNLEDQKTNRSTLFIDLIPIDEGSAFHTVGPHVVTCVHQGSCNKGCYIIPPYTPVGPLFPTGNPTAFTECECYGDEIGSHACNFKINKAYLGELVAVFTRIVASE
jgi:hypothetical protein